VDTPQVVLLVLGLLLLAGCVVWRLGRSRAARWWVGGRVKESAVLLGYPAFGVLLVTAGLSDVLAGSPGLRVLRGLLLVLALLAGIWAMFLPLPRWLLPDWLLPTVDERAAAKRQRKAARD
jgi:hypothetical protein